MANTKYYRIIKDHPVWEVGAILTNKESRSEYRPISNLWNKDLKNRENADFYESASLVEHQPEWFQQAYEISTLGKLTYGTKEAAKAAAAAMFKEK